VIGFSEKRRGSADAVPSPYKFAPIALTLHTCRAIVLLDDIDSRHCGQRAIKGRDRGSLLAGITEQFLHLIEEAFRNGSTAIAR
jgi:hypothetical protein